MDFQKKKISLTVVIKSKSFIVWQHLTTPDLMKKWMLDSDMELEISSEWKTGSAIVLKGKLHGIPFENNGIIKKWDPGKVLEYTHLSSISQLPDSPENYCMLTFSLTPVGNATRLDLGISNFPTESIYRHLGFYWRTALIVLKKYAEETPVK